MEKLQHQPYEEWLLDEAALNLEQKQELSQHLLACEACLRLSNTLREMDMEMRAAPVLAPAAGFTLRWQARLQAEQVRRHRRQTLWTMVLLVGGAMALFAMLLAAALPLLGMSRSFVVLGLYELTRTFGVVSSLGGALGTVVRVVLDLVPPTVWVAIFIALGGLAALWMVAMQQLTSPRRVVL